MRKLFFLTIVSMLAVSVCFAQQQSVSSSQIPAKVNVEVKSLAGKVESVVPGDAAKGMLPQITVVDDHGAKTVFSVKSNIAITDPAGKTITLDKIKKDDNVQVSYVKTHEGVNKAKSIVLK